MNQLFVFLEVQIMNLWLAFLMIHNFSLLMNDKSFNEDHSSLISSIIVLIKLSKKQMTRKRYNVFIKGKVVKYEMQRDKSIT